MLTIGRAARISLQRAPYSTCLQQVRTRAYAPPTPFRFMQARPMSNTNISTISCSAAAAPLGHYSHAIKAGNLLFVSGCLGIDPVTEQVVEGGIEAQTEQALKNLKAIVEEGGSSLNQVVKATVFLKDVNDFAAMNSVYGKFFGNHKPARSAIEIGKLPRGLVMEIECIAIAE